MMKSESLVERNLFEKSLFEKNLFERPFERPFESLYLCDIEPETVKTSSQPEVVFEVQAHRLHRL
jgi:hypothetical protein